MISPETIRYNFIIVQLDKTMRFDSLISGPFKAVLDRQKAYWTAKKGLLDREIEDLLQ